MKLTYMEEQEQAKRGMNCAKKLNFNAPLLSTKRPCGFFSTETYRTNCTQWAPDFLGENDRVPFSWEVVPGKPKEMQRNYKNDEDFPLTPKPPPNRWRLSKELATDVSDDHVDSQLHDLDDGCDGDVDDDDDDDAMDVFSLSAAMDIVEKAEQVRHGQNGHLSSDMVRSEQVQSPSFMIQRFLPDASALAASSSLAFSRNFNKQIPHFPEDYVSQTTGRSYCSPPRGCGLDALFPWRMKPKPCGIKSPVRKSSTNSKLQSNSRFRQNGKFDQLGELKKEGRL